MPGRNWHEAYLLVLTAAFATSAWLSRSEQQVIAATFPSWSQHLWYAGLIGGALIGLVGIVMHTLTGLLLDRGAQFWLAGLCGCYGLAFLAHAGRADLGHALFVIPLVVGYAAVCLIRARQIRREIDEYRAELRHLGDMRKAER